jgi:hypothetical protein
MNLKSKCIDFIWDSLSYVQNILYNIKYVSYLQLQRLIEVCFDTANLLLPTK